MSADTPPTETGGNLPPVEEASIYHLLKPEVLEHGDGRAVLRFTPEPIWTIGAGVVQGGIVTAMLDMAMAFASNGLSTATITALTKPIDWLTGDTLLDADDLDLLTSGLTVADAPDDPRIRERRSLFAWLEAQGRDLGRSYVSSVERYYNV